MIHTTPQRHNVTTPKRTTRDALRHNDQVFKTAFVVA